MTEKEYNKTVELMPKKFSKETIKELLQLNHTLQSNDLKFYLEIEHIKLIKRMITYNVVKHVYDECEFYNTLISKGEIWMTMEAYLNDREMTQKQISIFKNVIIEGLRRYADTFSENFNDFYNKCKEAGFLED